VIIGGVSRRRIVDAASLPLLDALVHFARIGAGEPLKSLAKGHIEFELRF
jgi:hypothetical protein